MKLMANGKGGTFFTVNMGMLLIDGGIEPVKMLNIMQKYGFHLSRDLSSSCIWFPSLGWLRSLQMVRDIQVFVNDHRPGTLDEFSFGQKDDEGCISLYIPYHLLDLPTDHHQRCCGPRLVSP